MSEAQVTALASMPIRLIDDEAPALTATAASVRVLKSEDILQGSSEIFIQHGPQLYRLRQTKTGKLLLYK